jgi:beta-phosphoglucomutase-like phosphatase (HAD superfamily)
MNDRGVGYGDRDRLTGTFAAVPALIFDYDGLLADTETLAATILVELLDERGVTTDFASMAQFFGSTGPENDTAWEQQMLAWLGPDGDPAAFEAMAWERIEARRHDVPLCSGVAELLAEAEHAGWQIAIGSGQLRGRLERHLSHLGVLDHFDEIVTAADVARGKPAPDIFIEVARRLGRPPELCVVLEDSLPGYEAACAAGMSVVVCPCEVTRHCSFPPEARVVATLHEVTLDDFHPR